MSFLTILETLLLGPLKLVFEIIFVLANMILKNPGLSIIVLSLVMNFLVLPLYKRADAMQEKARDIEAKLQPGVAHIKKTFTGDERMMILQTYYRQNNYKPTNALGGSVSLLLEVPFFMAAYQFLSNLSLLDGVSLGPIADLSKPDGLLVIGGFAINVLPILMTAINVVSSALYLKGYPLKTKIQLYGMAAFFLVFLYTSPAGLVFYWTLNNLFSLCKTIFYKLKDPKKILFILASAAGVFLVIFGLFIYNVDSRLRQLLIVGVGAALQLPLIIYLVLTHGRISLKPIQTKPNWKLFLLGAAFLTVLIGLLIPSNYIAASPQEFIDLTVFHHPLNYLISSVCLAAGTFLVWVGVFYWLATPGAKVIFERILWILCGVMLVNYMFFGRDLGIISSSLQYENGMVFTRREQLLNLIIVVLVTAVMLLLAWKGKKLIPIVLVSGIIALSGMSFVNISTIHTSVQQAIDQQSTGETSMPQLQLSKDGENVVVIMLDRAIGQYIPYIMNEKPELKEQFAGFTYYDNTISFGWHTNFGAPALFGGYEYTPVEMNKRGEEPLVSKHNEALLLMPVLFSQNGYTVTVCDAPYANYQWIPDLSIFDEYEDIQTYITDGRFVEPERKQLGFQNNHRNFFCFSLMKTLPVIAQPLLYNRGVYLRAPAHASEEFYSVQTAINASKAEYISADFMNGYNVLTNLSNMTVISDAVTNAFLSLTNNTTHKPMLLREPDYTPVQFVDNTQYDLTHAERFTLDGKTLLTENYIQMSHYQSNMAALIQLGNWFDYLRENGIYDNTRIILVSDHGYNLAQMDELLLEDPNGTKDLEQFFPLLMVKDFNAQEFTISHEFMTNADVPTLAVNGLIEDAKNPFTGKIISSEEKTAHDQFIILSDIWDVTFNNGNTFRASQWASVNDDIWNKENWTFYSEETVLTEHVAP